MISQALDTAALRADLRMPWRHAKTDAELTKAVRYYEIAIGRTYHLSPGSTAHRLLRDVQRQHAHWLGENGTIPAPGTNPNLETPYSWVRLPTAGERRASWLVSYDKNAMYLGACSALACGVGEPEHHDTLSVFSDAAKRPGYFRVLPAEGGSILLPSLFGGARLADGTRWVTQPTLALAIEQHAVYTIEEAYTYPQHHRVLEPWYERLRDARGKLKAQRETDSAYQIALDALKATYTYGIGWFDLTRLREATVAERGSALYRPLWRQSIIAQARANLYRRLIKLYAAQVIPFAVDIDCLYFLVDDPERLAVCPALPIDDTLGGFKRKDCVLTAELGRTIAALGGESGARAFRQLRTYLAEMRGAGDRAEDMSDGVGA